MAMAHLLDEVLTRSSPEIKSILVTFLVVLTAFLLYLRQLLLPVDQRRPPKGKQWKLPPGPQGWPIVGNLFLFAPGENAEACNRLASELYDKRSRITNGRPHYPVVGDLISLNNRTVAMQVEGWTERRRVMHHLLSGTALVRNQAYQNEESIRLLAGYLKSPRDWYVHHHHYSNSVIHRITFGERPQDNDDKVKALEHVQKLFLLNAPPMNIFDHFPELAKLPHFIQWWRKKYAVIGQMTLNAYSAYWNPLKRAIKDGGAPPSFARDVRSGEGSYRGSDVDAMFLAMQLVEAGSDTTRLTFNIFVFAAWSRSAKSFSKDEPKLSYVSAFAKELLRWCPIFIWTPEHTLTEDFAFEGYFYPKGTHFVINQPAISLNSDNVKDLLEFKPERWLDGYETDLTRGMWQFGGGRRVCVGHRLAQKSLFINLARLIYCFDYEAREPFDSSDINHFVEGEPFPACPRSGVLSMRS